MKYDIQFKPRAIKDVKGMPLRIQSQVLAKIEQMSNDLSGDVRRLTSFTHE